MSQSPPALKPNPRALLSVGAGVHCLDTSQRFYGLEVGARMTVLETSDGLFIHSPQPLPLEELQSLGDPRWVLAPNLLHHLYVGPWIDSGFETWAAPGLPQKRPDLTFHGVIQSRFAHTTPPDGDDNAPHVDPDANRFGSDLRVVALSCIPMTNEAVVLHRPSRTLVVTDLLFNIPAHAPWLTRAAMYALGGYPGCRTTLLERRNMRRAIAREELTELMSWDFDRLIMSHGQIIETGGKDALKSAFSWLLE